MAKVRSKSDPRNCLVSSPRCGGGLEGEAAGGGDDEEREREVR